MPIHPNARTASIGARVARTKGATNSHARGKLWYALRVLRNTTARELMAVAENEHKRSVLQFLRFLRIAGFVRAQSGHGGLHEPTRFLLIRDPGPKCPSILKRGTVLFDHNTDTEYPLNGR